MLAKMSLFWNDSSTTGSPKKVVEQKCLTKSVPSKDLTKEQIDQAKEEKSVCERVEPSSDQTSSCSHEGEKPTTVQKEDKAEERSSKEKKCLGKEKAKEETEESDKEKDVTEAEKENSNTEEDKSVKTKDKEGNKKDEKVSKSREEEKGVTAFKRKLDHEKTVKSDVSYDGGNDDAVVKGESSSASSAKTSKAGQVKKMKRSHEISTKSANAISSSLSSSLLDSEDSRKGKRKLRSPESGLNERKLPKTEDEEVVVRVKPVLELAETVADEDDQTREDETLPTASPTKSVAAAGVERRLSNETQNSTSFAMSTSSFTEADETDFGPALIHPDPEDEFSFTKLPSIPEVDRRREISNIDALAADQERDRARAQSLLSAFDESDNDDGN